MRTSDGRPVLLAVVGQTATGKSALALTVATRSGGEIINCDSTAVYRGFDIGTDKVPQSERRGIPHHLIDVAEPTEIYSAARYSRDAARLVREVTARDRLPVVVGGTGLYFRALTRGLFAGPGRDAALRGRLGRVARRRGVETLHRWLGRHDPDAAHRIHARDEKRLVRALEVYLLTGRTLTDHFADTRSPIDDYLVVTVGLQLPGEELVDRITRRVEQQFASGLLDEIRGLLDAGVPPDAGPFGGLVYRQALEHLQGVRDEAATRELIVRENRRYARRQLIWFRKEPNLRWLCAPGERVETSQDVSRILDTACHP
jgi:tRNA dimethylallyltransferase